MLDFNVNLKAYEKIFNDMCEKVTECCIKLSQSGTEEDIMISSEVSYTLAEVLEKFDNTSKDPRKLVSFYMKVENVILDSIDKLSKTWAYEDNTIKKSFVEDFISEEAQFSDGIYCNSLNN
jgi:hypothetical protein